MKYSQIIYIFMAFVVLTCFLFICTADAENNLLLNPGFEEGTYSWSKHGGTFSTVRSPVRNGACAASLTSNTESRKWIYQISRVIPGESYEFSGWAVRGTSGEHT
jgi:hypothetical protein